MRQLRRFWKRLMSPASRRRDEERWQAEMEEHLALQTAENVRTGQSPEEARRQAVLKFGARAAIQEEHRAELGLPSLEALVQDTRYAVRRLRKAPAFTLSTVLTLALGIGATTAIFTLVYAVLLKSLAVAKPGELYRLGKEARCCYWGGYSQDKEFSLVSYDLYKHLRDHTDGFVELAAFPAGESVFGVRRAGRAGRAESHAGEFVSGNYFKMFGIGAYAGRALTERDDRANAAPVAMMSYRLWRDDYGSDSSVMGSVFNFDGKPFTVVGVTPPGFFGDTLRANPPDFFLPLNAEPYAETDSDLNKVSNHWLALIGRIRPGLNPASVEAEMRVELKQWLRSHWGEMDANERAAFPRQTLFLRPGGAGMTSMREQYEHWLQILMLVTGFVLLMVCANVANLMLVRGLEQRRQISLSRALGARAGRVMSQALTESLLLALLGGVAGLAIAFAGTRLIVHFAFPPVLGRADVPIDASPSLAVLLFAISVSVMTGIAFGMAPAWLATRVDPIEALRGSGRSTSRTGSLPRKVLVVLQAALSLFLLCASGLLTTVLHKLENQDFGFEQQRRLVVGINPQLAGYDLDRLEMLHRRIHDSLAAVPGVAGVALCTFSPLSGRNWGSGVFVDGRTPPGPKEDNFASMNRVTPGYFDVTGNRILRGRGIDERDTATSQHVAVVNEAFARRYFPNEEAVGRHFGRLGPEVARAYEIVGVARDARYSTMDLDKPIGPLFFLPDAQHDFPAKAGAEEVSPGSHFLPEIVIETKPGATVTSTQVNQAVAKVDANLPVISVRALEEQVGDVFRQERLIARLTSFFGVLSLVLACVGLYGVTAYNAGVRTSEIGVRMALGADRRSVISLILRGAIGLIVFGLLAGVPLALAAGRFMGNQLYGVDPQDPAVLVTALGALGLSALVAALIPAVRASATSPLEALRSE